MSLIRLTNIEKSYRLGERLIPVLKKLSLEIQTGEMLAICGASGSGKSTLMNLIGLLDKADSGEYLLDGRNIQLLAQDALADLRNQQIGFVFQQFNLLPRFSALQNVCLPLYYRPGLTDTEIHKRAHEALLQVGMDAYARQRPSQLSGGQQQRIAIARALVGNPKILLADEPTGALDSATGKEIMEVFAGLHREGRTLILITHDEHIAALCQRQIHLVDGSIVTESTHEL